MAFNISAAVNHLIANSSASSLHLCARFVRQAIEAGGLSTAGRPDWAYKYVNYLPTIGFKNIAILDTLAQQTNFQAQPGDIAVYQKPGAGTSQPGHICMWSGSQWISDFRQSHMSVYRSRGDIRAFLFRYTGETTFNPNDLLDSMSTSGGATDRGWITTSDLAAYCPPEIELKGMWMRYQLQMGERSAAIRDLLASSAANGSDGMPGIGAFVGGGIYDIPGGFPNDSQLQKYVYQCEGHVTVKWATSPTGAPLTDTVCPGYDLPGGVHAKVIMDAAGLTPELALGGRSLNQVNYCLCRPGLGSERGNAYTAYLHKPGKYSSDLEPPAEYWAKLIPYYRDRIIEGWNQPIAQREPDIARRWALCHGMCWGYSQGWKNKIYQSYTNYANTDDFINRAPLQGFIKNAYKHGLEVATKVLRT